MPRPAISLKIRRFRRRFGITAPQVVVRSRLPGFVYGVIAGLLLLLVGLAFWEGRVWLVASEAGHDAAALRDELNRQQVELADLRSRVGTGANAVSIERAAQQKLLAHMASLERENAVLKEEILLFERLVPAVGEEGVIRIENFRVARESEGRLRYRALLAFQPSKQIPEFRGYFQLLVTCDRAGKEVQLLYPEKRGDAAAYGFEMRHFLRREGVIDLPEGAVFKAAELRVMQGDTLRTKRLAQP